MAIAAKSSGGQFGFKSNLDVLVARTPSNVIAEGQKLADSFRLGGMGMNAVEADVLIAQMKINAIILVRGARAVVINQTRIPEGEAKALPIDGETVNLMCVAVEARSAEFKMGAYEFTITSK